MKKSVLSFMVFGAIAMLGGTSAVSAQEPDSSYSSSRRIGAWTITREYESESDDNNHTSHYDIYFSSSSNLPFFYMGFDGLLDGPLRPSLSPVRINEAKSWEYGFFIPLSDIAICNSEHVGVSTALGIGRCLYKFDYPNYFYNVDHHNVVFGDLMQDGNAYDETWLRFCTLRLPVQLVLRSSSEGFFFTCGPELEYRFSTCSKGRCNGWNKKRVITRDLDVHPLGINLLAQIGFDDISVMARASLVELFAHSVSAEYASDGTCINPGSCIYPFSISVGIGF